jgi:DNA-3-methyladenine glycosylase
VSGAAPADRSAVIPSGPRRFGRSGSDPLSVEFFARDADLVARELLGCRLVSTIGEEYVAGEIVETEAYVGPDDEASHAHRRFGVTARNAPMFGAPGLAYVYRIYGVHWCVNAVTGESGYGAAVLIRALRPLQGLEAMRSRRAGRLDRDLARGPANLCRALGIDGTYNLHPLDSPPLWIEAGLPQPDHSIARGPRIGISRATGLPLRFWVRGSPWVSGRTAG